MNHGIEKKTVIELKEICKSNNLVGYSKKRKPELIKLINNNNINLFLEEEESSVLLCTVIKKNSSQCVYEGCYLYSSFNLPNEKAKYCKEHRSDNMVDVRHKKCGIDGCIKKPNFNERGTKIGIRCEKHKLPTMVNVLIKKCDILNCETRASFNILGQKPTVCAEHQIPGMVNVLDKKCEFEECMKLARYNIISEKNGVWCIDHKKTDMVIVKKHSMCKYNNCEKQPSFNFLNKKGAKYCFEHKEDNMVDVINKSCKFDGCTKQPNFNNLNEISGIFCSEHKEQQMVNVTSIKCETDGCLKRPTYNKPGKKPQYCKKHRQTEMVNVLTHTCITDDCLKMRIYNILGEKPMYCKQHKTDNMINVADKRCKTPLCDIIVRKKFEGYCLRCFIHLFPDRKISRNYKTKETHVGDFVKEAFPDKTFLFDKKIEDSCLKSRPDILIDMGFQVIIVEVDETQHKNYNYMCENKRMMKIWKTINDINADDDEADEEDEKNENNLNYRSVIFIRFNPDGYSDNGTIIDSCWKLNSKGICQTKKDKLNEWNDRLNELKNQIEYWSVNKTDKVIEVVHLFYDK